MRLKEWAIAWECGPEHRGGILVAARTRRGAARSAVHQSELETPGHLTSCRDIRVVSIRPVG